MWFSYDGETFQTHNTEAEAIAEAKDAMEEWSDRAGDGWDEQSTQVMCGLVTHMVRVEQIEVTDENRHLVPSGCECLEEHFLERVTEDPIDFLQQWLIEKMEEEVRVMEGASRPLAVVAHREAYNRFRSLQKVAEKVEQIVLEGRADDR